MISVVLGAAMLLVVSHLLVDVVIVKGLLLIVDVAGEFVEHRGRGGVEILTGLHV